MRVLAFFLLLATPICLGQTASDLHTINVSADAEVQVVPDRVTIMFAVETRGKELEAASSQTDAAVKRVIAAARQLGVEEGDIQTDEINVDIAYDDKAHGMISYYTTTKGIQVILKDVAKFEPLLQAGLKAGANKVDKVSFSTSELRKYRDQARAMAVKAAIEKAHDLASAAGIRIADKPLNINSSSGGGIFGNGYSRGRMYGYNAQNAVQNYVGVEGGGAQESVALGKISVTASVEMLFLIE
jgi:uncharacterized protein